MTLAILGSIFIVVGIAALAAGVALPVAYALRQRQAARPTPQVERVSA